MSTPVDPRYAHLELLRAQGDRITTLARDCLTGTRVVIKRDSLEYALRELRILLALPPRVGPPVYDAIWTAQGQLALVLQELSGPTLMEAAETLAREDLPHLVRALCVPLGHLHRAGFVHADLKPANILLCDGQPTTVRLLDFGFALSRHANPHLPSEGRGGTPPFAAPELLRNWIVDGRADQYSLGMTLQQLWPELAADVRWAPLIERLCERIPGRRFPHMTALREEVTARFGLAPCENHGPRLGGGPLRGRATQMRDLITCPGDRVLVQARRGSGLTRFLHEGVLAMATREGPALRCIDVTALGRAVPGEAIVEMIARLSATGGKVFCGVPDPSPGLRWVSDAQGERLREEVSQAAWERIILDPPPVDHFEELIADAMGTGGAMGAEISRALHARADGDLQNAAEGFAHLMATCGREVGERWEIAPEHLAEALGTWHPAPTQPVWVDIAPEHADALTILARAGSQLPVSVAGGLLECFSERMRLTLLLDHGYLRAAAGGEPVEFVTQALWRAACEAAGAQAEEIDRWLCEHAPPDPHRPAEVIAACRRARRLGATSAEARWLTAAFTLAHAEERRDRLQQLFAYPESAAPAWNETTARAQARRLADILETPWSEDRILLALAYALGVDLSEVSTPLLERLIDSDDPEVSIQALMLRLDQAIPHDDAPIVERLSGQLEAHAAAPPGIAAHFHALRAHRGGDPTAAEAWAEQAAAGLRGSGLPFESYNLQTLAILQFYRDPARAIETMTRALAAATAPEQRGQLRYNLTMMHSRIGDFEGAAACADAGIREAGDRLSHTRLAGLRVHRAWAWADLDRTELALREARDLLSLAAVRAVRSYFVSTRLLIGYCQLHRSLAPAALTEAARAWHAVAESRYTALRTGALRALIDTALDLGAWETVREYGETLRLPGESTHPIDVTAAARAEALRCQAAGENATAVSTLEEHLDLARGLSERAVRARYLHHLGCAHLGARNPQRAEELLREEIDILTGLGYGYYRASALRTRALALLAAGAAPTAAETLEEAITLARRIESLGLLSLCLRERAAITISGQ